MNTKVKLMKKKQWHAVLQLFLIFLIGIAALAIIGSLFTNITEETKRRNFQLALHNISLDRQLLSTEDLSTDHLRQVYYFEDGHSIYELAGQIMFADIHMLVRLNSAGTIEDYQIISINNHLQGWEFGNSFAYYELVNEDNNNPRTRIWQEYIQYLVRVAEEHHS